MDSVDEVSKKFAETCQSIQKKLNASSLICQLPIGKYQGIEGIIDLVEKKAYYFTPGDKEENPEVKEIPSSYEKQVQEFRQKLIEKVIEHDEGIANKYLSGQELSVSEIKSLIRVATLTGKHFPVFCGSAYKHVGVKLLLDGVADYLPSPLDRHEINALVDGQEKKISILDNPSETLALAFKTIRDYFVGKLTFLRIYRGKINANSYIHNLTNGTVERVSRLLRIHANEREIVSEALAGDIIAAVGFKNTSTGDTLSNEKGNVLLETINFAEPVISLAIEPKTKKDQDELSKGLKILSEEDPTFLFNYNSETGQMIISGMGELHLEVLINRLLNEFKIQVNSGKPEVAYRETIKNSVFIEHIHKKQTGGAGEYAVVQLQFEPNPGQGFTFVDALKGEDIPRSFVKPIEQGVIRSLSVGPLLGYPLVDVKAILLGGKHHPVDSSSHAFERAGHDAFKENTDKFELTLLEPIMEIEIGNISHDHYGAVLASISSKRGKIVIDENEGEYENPSEGDSKSIKAKVPLAEIFGYSTTLREITGGRGVHSLQFSHYQEVPLSVREKLIDKKK